MSVSTIENKEAEAKEAKYGEKMIEIKVRLWTNDLANEEGKIIPKHAWTSGVVSLDRNESHGIETSSPIPFHSLMDLGSVIEGVLIDNEIVLHPSPRMQKYTQD